MRALPELLSPFVSRPLNSEKLEQLQLYLDLLLKWNARINLTAVRDAEQSVQRHFGESIFAGEQLKLDAAESLIDVGSGAGFPGLPIKIMAPHLHVTLVESQQKKATFLREVIRALALQDTSVHAGRAEEVTVKSQIVTMRAVERFETVLPTAAAMVQNGWKLALLIGSAQGEIARKVLPQLNWQQPIPIPESRARQLLIGYLLSRNDPGFVPIPSEDFQFSAEKIRSK